MPSLTVENYLKAALQASLRTGQEHISTGESAAALAVSPGTVTSMLKTLSESGLAVYRPYEGMKLTKAGRGLALRVLRRHRLIELFLVQTLDLTWDQVHEEAEHMEHSVSDFLVDRIDTMLGHPSVDPHGDPIPGADGELREPAGVTFSLASCPAGSHMRLVRVTNQGPEFLRYLSENGFELGVTGIVRENNVEAGIVSTQLGDRVVSMGHPAAESLLVEAVEATP